MLAKNLKKIVAIALVIIVVLLFVILKLSNKQQYTITVEKIDDQSPSRILKVFEGNKEVSFKEIRYKDDVFLCRSTNPTVFYGDILDEEELKVVLNENDYVIAKIDKGGENENK